MKTLKISDETHQKLKLIQAWINLKTLDDTINDLIECSPVYQMQLNIESKKYKGDQNDK